jgi:Bardet-Biedl syndrome 7 protein
VNVIERYPTQKKGVDREFIYGTSNGIIGQLFANNTSAEKGWAIENDDHLGGINCITICDITRDGVQDIIVGRDDGHLEVYSYGDSINKPNLIFRKALNESIQSLDHGKLMNNDKEDIIVATYSGMFSLFLSSLFLIDPQEK